MALPTNNGFADCELSAEELDAIAAGHWWNTVWHAVVSAHMAPIDALWLRPSQLKMEFTAAYHALRGR
jgi:hypothetical protein